MNENEHIEAACVAAERADDLRANPVIHAALAQAHALVAIAILLERLVCAVEKDEAGNEFAQTVAIWSSSPGSH